MKIKQILMLTFLGLSSNSFAASILHVPEQIQLVAVNGQSIQAAALNSNDTRYKINDGVNALTLRYVQFFDQARGGVKSEQITINTPQLLVNENYRLNLIDAPSDYTSAQQFALSPKIALYDKNQRVIAQQITTTRVLDYTPTDNISPLQSDNGIIDLTTRGPSIIHSRNNLPYEGESSLNELKAKTNFISAPNDPNLAQPNLPATTTIRTTISPQSKNSSTQAEQKLMQDWQQASLEERRRFMNWLSAPVN